ncbi:MAG: lamin tail domain-containing protein [candidate division Zixibacteria bacterium]|nr:lamin tail domain-containing protein [candidate division Zixibacteria bacterium]
MISKFLISVSMLILSCIIINNNADAGVTLTEVLANEPGRYSSLEWFEVYNPGPGSEDISGWLIIDDGDTNYIPAEAIIPAGNFAVLSRRPFSSDTSLASFEKQWGNNSGVWGDSPAEDYPLIEVAMSLRNSEGKIVLCNQTDSISGFKWQTDAGDGLSFEKQDIDGLDILSNWAVSSSIDGSTPGNEPGTIAPPTIDDIISFNLDPEVVFLKSEQSTTLTFSFPLESEITLQLFDINGKLLRTLYNEDEINHRQLVFDCTDESGNVLTGGIYIFYCKISGSLKKEFKKVLVIAG